MRFYPICLSLVLAVATLPAAGAAQSSNMPTAADGFAIAKASSGSVDFDALNRSAKKASEAKPNPHLTSSTTDVLEGDRVMANRINGIAAAARAREAARAAWFAPR